MTARAGTRPWLAGATGGIDLRQLVLALAWPGVLVLGIGVRAYHVLRHPFPLNDGGLFYVMADDIQRNGFLLPEWTSYNGGDIPFAYPPAALYLAAVLDALLPVSSLTLFRVLPLLGAIATVFAFAALARTLLPGRREAVLATAAFALMPAAFTWMLPGGGLPRGFALALVLLATRQAHLLVHAPDAPGRWHDRAIVRSIAFTAVLSAATVLCHLETAAFLALTFALLGALTRPRGAVRIAVVAVLTVVATAPWWGLVVARHGFEPFLATMDQGGALLDDGRISWPALRYALLHPLSTGEPNFALLASLAAAGGLLALLRRRVFLPLWCVALSVAAMRASPTFGSVPAALLAGMALGTLMDAAASTDRARLPVQGAVLGGCLLFAGAGALSSDRGPSAALHPLSEADRQAMAWAGANSAPGSTFAVASDTGWWVDAASEWFPALARRESVATPQGYEWVEGQFAQRLALHDALGRCADDDASCLDEAMDGTTWTHVYVPSSCCQALKDSLRESPQYAVEFDAAGALIARKR